MLFCTTTLAFSNNLTANTPVSCPSSITCNFDEGTCDISNDWFYSSIASDEQNEFPDGQPILLSSISSYQRQADALGYPISKEAREKNGYVLFCAYRYGKYSFISISRYAKNIIGSNWVKYNFGQTHATCSDISNPEECAGEN